MLKQDIVVKSHDEIAFNVHLKDNISYFVCFLVAETEKYIVVVETTIKGTEELRIIPKTSIISVDVLYDLESMMAEIPEDSNDIMFT